MSTVTSHIRGTVVVSPAGRTQAEKEYILKSVLAHQPPVLGAESSMDVYVQERRNGEQTYCSHNELDEFMLHRYPTQRFHVYDTYLLTLDAVLWDCLFEDALRQLVRWLTRLAKRVQMLDCLVKVDDFENSVVLDEDRVGAFFDMFEPPSWGYKQYEPTWTDLYLLPHEYREQLLERRKRHGGKNGTT